MAHIVPLKTNLITFFSLVALTIITVLTAKFVDLGDYNLALAMVIAGFKAFVVFSWFMHLRYDGKYLTFVAICSVFFLGLFVGISYLDIASRAQ